MPKCLNLLFLTLNLFMNGFMTNLAFAKEDTCGAHLDLTEFNEAFLNDVGSENHAPPVAPMDMPKQVLERGSSDLPLTLKLKGLFLRKFDLNLTIAEITYSNYFNTTVANLGYSPQDLKTLTSFELLELSTQIYEHMLADISDARKGIEVKNLALAFKDPDLTLKTFIGLPKDYIVKKLRDNLLVIRASGTFVINPKLKYLL